MRPFRFAAVGLLAAAIAAVPAVTSAAATLTSSFSATDVAACDGSSTVTLTIQAQNPPPVLQAADIVLLVDASGSIGASTFDTDVKPSLNNFINYAAPSSTGNHIGVVEFDTGAQPITSGLLDDQTILQTDVNNMPYTGGYTYTLDGLEAAEAMLTGPTARAGAPKVIIVETDGVWDPASQDPTTYAANLVASGTAIFAVGVGAAVNTADLTAIAGGDASHVFSIADYSSLESTLNSALLEAIPAATNLTYNVTPASGWTIANTSATSGTATVSGGDLAWSLASIDSPTGTTITITYTEQHTGLTGGAAVPLASAATLAYTDATGTAQTVDYSGQTVAVSGCDTVPPLVSNVVASPNPVPLNTGSTLTATVDDTMTGDSNIASAAYSLDKGSWTPMSASDGAFDSPTEQVTAQLPGEPAAGVHTVCVRGADVAGNVSDGSACIQFAVYDPSAGFVTGGGWIASPAGACQDTSVCTDTTGKATFGFVSRYKSGASVPTGSTQFVFHAGNLHFASTSYQWLVVNQAGTNAQFKGEGTINGTGDYQFMIWAKDGSPDTFRIQITDQNGNTVYDNGVQQAIGGGSIIVHS